MARSSPVKMRLRPLGRWSIPSLKPTIGFAPTSAVAGARKRLTPSSPPTAVGTIPDLRRLPADERAAGGFLPALIAVGHGRPDQRRTVLPRKEMMKATRKLHEIGQSLWLDDITRGLLTSGMLHYYVQKFSVTGLTSNPTIFDHAIKNSQD